MLKTITICTNKIVTFRRAFYFTLTVDTRHMMVSFVLLTVQFILHSLLEAIVVITISETQRYPSHILVQRAALLE